MSTISFDTRAPRTEKTPLGISSENKPIPQGKKARSLFSQVVVVTSLFLGPIACAYLSSSSASSSVVKQSLLQSVTIGPSFRSIFGPMNFSCPSDCGPPGNGKERCNSVGVVTGTCYLNGRGNACACLSRLRRPCFIEM